MANFLSQTYIPQETRQDTNFPLLAQIMQMKQGKYDANRAKVQQTLDAFGLQSQQLLRDEDKEYVHAKLSDITSKINAFGNKDLSQLNVTEDLTGMIRTAASDPIIQNAIQNTQKFNKFQKEVATLKEKDPDLYSDINYQYALEASGIKSYINGETNSIGDLSYSPYNDYNKRIGDNILDLLGKQGKRTTQIRLTDSQGNPTGEMKEVEIDGLSPDQLRSVAQAMLTPQDLKQIEIDGWYSNGGYDNPAIIENVKEPLKQRIATINQSISINQKKLKESTGKEKQLTLTQIQNLEDEKVRIEKNIKTLTSDPRAASTFLQRESVINNITAQFAPLYSESQSIVKDDAYWARMDYNLKLAKEQRQANENSQKQNPNIDFSVVSTGTGELPNLPKIEQEIDNQITSISTELNATLNSIKYALEQEAENEDEDAKTQLEILNSMLENKGDKTDIDVIQEFVLKTNSTNDPLILVDEQGNNLRSKFKRLSDELLLYNEGYQQATKKAKDRHIDLTLNNEKTFKAFNENKNTNMLWKGQSVPVHRVLKAEKLMDESGKKIGDLKNKPELLKELQKSYYASDVLNKFTPITPFTDKNSLRELASYFNEPIDNIIQTVDLGVDNSGRKVVNNSINPNTKTGQYLLQARSNGIYDRFAFNDQDLSKDDSTIGGYITKNYKDDPTYVADLNKFRNKLANNQQIGVSYDTDKETYNNLIRTAQNKNALFEREEDSNINIRKEDQEIVLQSISGKDEKILSEARLSLPEFQNNFPELTQQLDFATQASIYTYDRLGNKPIPSEPIKFINNSSSELYQWATDKILTGSKAKYTPLLTSEDTYMYLNNKYRDLNNSIPQFNNLIKKLLDESSNYSVQLKFSGKFGQPKLNLSLIDKTKKIDNVINTVTLDNTSEADDFKEVIDEIPQVYYGILLDNILLKQRNSLNLNGSSNPNYTKLIESINTK